MTEERKKEIIDGLEKSRNLFKERKLEEAQKTIDDLISSLSDDELVMEDEKYEYVDFKSPIEEGIYRAERRSIEEEKKEIEQEENSEDDGTESDIIEEESDKDLKLTEYPVSNLYVLSGSIAMERQDYGKALEQLEEAMNWNPINPEIAFEYAEVVKRMGSVDQFFELNKRIFPHTYTTSQLAHAYRNAAYYYESKKEAHKAIAMIVFANEFEENDNAKKELQAIMKEIGTDHLQITTDEIEEICKADNIQFGPDMGVVQMAARNGIYFLNNKNYQMAYFFLSIAYNLTHDQNIKKKLDEAAGQIKNK